MYLRKNPPVTRRRILRTISMMLVFLLLLSIYPVPMQAYADDTTPPADEQPADDGGTENNLDEGISPLADPPEPLNLNTLSSSRLTTKTDYYDSASESWIPYTDDVALEVTTLLRITLNYDLSLTELKEHGGVLVYNIPEPLRGIANSADFKNDTVTIGHIDVTADKVTVSYNKQITNSTDSDFRGSAEFTATIDPTSVPDDDQVPINGDGIHIVIKLQPDSFYKYDKLTLVKNSSCVKHTEGYYYIDYTLQLKADNAMTKAVVIDRFSKGGDFVDSYMGIGSTETTVSVGTSVASDGSPAASAGTNQVHFGQMNNLPADGSGLVWQAYDLTPGETRTLYYRVKLKNSFVLQAIPGEIYNQASAYSATTAQNHPNIYLQSESGCSVLPKAKIDLTKVGSEVRTNSDGQEYIDYTLTATAPEDNTYTISNITLHDWFDSGTKGKLLFDFESFQSDGQRITAKQSTENWGNIVEIPIASLAPGGALTITYRVMVDPLFYTTFSGRINLVNYAQAVVHDGNLNTDVWLRDPVNNIEDNKISYSVPIGKQWRRKNVSPATLSETTIDMDGNVFDAVGTPSAVTAFTVPEKSFPYEIIVNEGGKWSLENTTFKDVLDPNMWYQGYVKIESVNVHGAAVPVSATQAQAFEAVANLPAEKTVWLKVDRLSSFSFKPKDLGFPTGDAQHEYAYRLLYYARPMVNVTMTARNRFYLLDTAGANGQDYPLNFDDAWVDVSVVGTQHCTLHKKGWYFTQPADPNNYFADRVTQYWIVDAVGDMVSGLKIKDVAGKSVQLPENAFLGVFIGKADTVFDAYRNPAHTLNLPEVQEVMGLRALTEGTDYQVDGNDTLTLLRNIVPESDEHLFLIIRTRMTDDISGYESTGYFTTNNGITHSYDNGHSWANTEYATMIIYNSNGAVKSPGPVYAYTGARWVEPDSGKTVNLPRPDNTASGLHVSWLVSVNTTGLTDGKATVIDTLPEGLELDYVSLQSIGPWLGGHEPIAAVPAPDAIPGDGFEAHPMPNEGVYCNNATSGTPVMAGAQYYYNPATRTVVWAMDRLRTQGSPCLNYAVTFRVIARVSDADYRDGQNHSYVNRAAVRTKLGTQLLESENQFCVPSLKKTGNQEVALSSGIYPFTLDVNPNGLELDPDNPSVILVDELNGALVFMEDSLTIYETLTETPLSPDRYAVAIRSEPGKTIVEFTLPDATALTIQYDTRVNAAPDSKTAVSNLAYWKGFTPTEDTEVIAPEFMYHISGTGSTYSDHATLQITKKSSANLLVAPISGAVYTLTPIQIVNGTPTGGTALNRTATENSGVYTYDFLNFNTVYRIEETTAPAGYLKDSGRYYVAVANLGTDKKYQTDYDNLLETIRIMTEKGFSVNCMYTDDTIAITLTDAPDYRYSLTVRKIDGDTTAPLAGVGFTVYREVTEDTVDAQTLDTSSGIRYGIPIRDEELTVIDAQGYATVTFTNLDAEETYYVKETTGLYGYLISETAIPITVSCTQNADGSIARNALIKGIPKEMEGRDLSITVSNFSKMDMPTSGVFNTGNTFFTFGAVFLLLSIGILLSTIKQQYILSNQKERD